MTAWSRLDGSATEAEMLSVNRTHRFRRGSRRSVLTVQFHQAEWTCRTCWRSDRPAVTGRTRSGQNGLSDSDGLEDDRDDGFHRNDAALASSG